MGKSMKNTSTATPEGNPAATPKENYTQPPAPPQPEAFRISVEDLKKFGEVLNTAVPNEYIRRGVFSAINDLFTPILPDPNKKE